MNARVKRQGGWAGSFVIVGILLALLLVGGVYFLKSYQVQDGDIAVDTSTDEKTTGENGREDSSNGGTSNDTDQSSGEDEQVTNGSETSDDNLPETGPSETIATSAILAVLTYSSVLYVRSRRSTTL
jgi:hypothetical protein